MVSLPLTTREVKVLRYIRRYVARHECAPTIREIAQGTGNGPPERVATCLDALVRKGCIRWTAGRHRSIALAEANLGPRHLLWNLSAFGEMAPQAESSKVLCETD